MNPKPLVLAALLLFPLAAAPAAARDSDSPHLNASCCDPPTRWAARHDPRDAELAITTTGGEAVLILTEKVVAIQLSDRVMREVRREMRKEQNKEADNPIARALKSVILSGVRALLDHSAECPIRELRDAEYADGRLILTTRSGEQAFKNIEIDDRIVLEDFSASDAREFVRQFRRMKARMR